MGQMSRMNRCGRFINEFCEDIVRTYPLQKGDVLTVKNVCLSQTEGGGDEVDPAVDVRAHLDVRVEVDDPL